MPGSTTNRLASRVGFAWPVVVVFAWLLTTGCSDDSTRPPQQQVPSSSQSESTNAVGAKESVPRSDQPVASTPFSSRSAGQGDTLFATLDPKQVGIDFAHQWTKRPGQLRNNTTGSGVCMGDYDGDGWVDVFLARSTDGGRLYRNLGHWKFEDVTDNAGVGGAKRWSTGCTFVDIDNDGDLDLYVCGFDCPNHLYINQGDGAFVERGHEYGLDYQGSSAMMAFADYDRDGDLDGYLLTNHIPPDEEIEYSMEFDRRGVPRVPLKYREYHDLIRMPDGDYGVIEVGQYDHFYRNDGEGRFVEATHDVGIAGNHKGLSATWWDYNDDGWPDIYVANDFFGQDILYRNNGDGTFTDAAPAVLPHTPWFSMGSDLGDLNNDGLLDFMGTDMSADSHYRSNVAMGDIQDEGWFLDVPTPRQYMRNAVYLGTGEERVWEIGYQSGLESTNWTWSTRLVDLDQDGRLDVHITNGMSRDWANSDMKAAALELGPPNSNEYNSFWDDQPPLREANFAFRNLGDYKFENVGGEWGLDSVGVSFGAAFGDLDNDGDLDLVVNNFDEPVSIYRNDGASGDAIQVRLSGVESNRWGVGAKVTLRAGDQLQTRYLSLARGFMSSSDPTLHFGVGDAAAVDELTIEWPSGAAQTLTNLATNQRFVVIERADEGDSARPDASPSHLFALSDRLEPLKHREKPFNDFAQQPLLPWRLSRMGPGIAVGDVNGDGNEDVVLGAGVGYSAALMLNHGAGAWTFSPELFPPWGKHSSSEDNALLLFDADGDGDQDLFVSSGSVECRPDDSSLRDRLYLNGGDGKFESATNSIPDVRESSSCAAAADFDRDGDLDLFVGAGSIPGSYPKASSSRLLENREGLFGDVTETAAADLTKLNLTTAALWTDVDNDGWSDLIVTQHWGPIRVFHNDRGRLHDATESAGLAELQGWWSGISGRDCDGDGDVDYVVTNFGRNTVYRVSEDRPAHLYYGSFGYQDQWALLEAHYDAEGKLVPLRSKQLLGSVIPQIDAQFPTYDKYASASLAEIVSQKALDAAIGRMVNISDNVLLRNDGDGRFTVEPLPAEAQFAPGFGVVLSDFDADGLTDAFLAQNFFGPRRETGRMDGGMGVLLSGQPDGSFSAVAPGLSGLIAPGDARSVVTLDLNDDGRLDILIGINGDRTLAFEKARTDDRGAALISLQGPPGNPLAVGARVTVKRDDGLLQTAEVYAGSGYLSHQTSKLEFGFGETGTIESIEIRWPSGETSSYTPDAGARKIEIAAPKNTAQRE